MKITQEEVVRELYNLILNSGTREWERTLLMTTRNALENQANFEDQLAKLESELRPLASRNNLTPDVTDFYLKLTGDPVGEMKFDMSHHRGKDLAYQERAIFGGGCFWCMVEPFETKPGIISVLSGYTGHVEGVEIIFDTRIVSYEELVELYWQLTDPTDALGQFQDRGTQYRPIIFVQNTKQKKIAETSKQQLIESGKYKRPIVTEIQQASIFWPAENYHQQFYKKQPKRYKSIKRARYQLLNYLRLKDKIRSPFNKDTK